MGSGDFDEQDDMALRAAEAVVENACSTFAMFRVVLRSSGYSVLGH